MLALIFSCVFALTGCASAGGASTGDALIEFDTEMFKARVDEVLKIGMKFGEAKKLVVSTFSKPAASSTMAPVIQGKTMQLEGKRYIMTWTTTTPGKNISLTLFIDHQGKLVRWTVGAFIGDL